MSCKRNIKNGGVVASEKEWSDLAIAVGYHIEGGERSLKAIHEEISKFMTDVTETDVALAAREVIEEIENPRPRPTSKPATMATLKAEVKRLTDPTAIERANTLIKKLDSENASRRITEIADYLQRTEGLSVKQATAKAEQQYWSRRYNEIVDEARHLNRGSKVEEDFYMERDAAMKDPAVREARLALNRRKAEADKFLEDLQRKAEREAKGIAGAFWSTAADAISLPRAVAASLDLSAPGRQGLLLIYANPAKARKALRAQFQSLSEKGADVALLEMQEHPRYDEVVADGRLSIGDPHGFQTEEPFASRFAKIIPGVKQSERAYGAFLSRMRLDWYGHMADSIEQSTGAALTPKERKQLADFVNVATGRGSALGLDQGGQDVANKVFFSLRWNSSRLQYLTGQPMWNVSPRVRKEIAKTYAKTMMGYAVTATVLGLTGNKIGSEADKSDIGRAIRGATRFDITGGLSKWINFFARTGYTLAGDDKRGWTPWNAIRFVRGTLSPAAGMAVDMTYGKGENPYTKANYKDEPWRAATGLFLPIGVQNIMQGVEKKRPNEEIARDAALEFLGISSSTWEDTKK